MTATKIVDLTGPGRTDRFGVGGTDLGAMVTAPDGRLVAVFGDTFETAGVGGAGWRSPVVLFADPAAAPDSIEWTGSAGGPADYADQVVEYRHHGRKRFRHVGTVLPTDLLTVGDRIYLHVMVCAGLGKVHWTELHHSDDNGQTWRPTGTRWRSDHLGGLFQMLTWDLGDDGHVYACTTGFQRDQGLVVHRVPADRVTDRRAWRVWSQTDADWLPHRGLRWWQRAGRRPDPRFTALPGKFGELCLRRRDGNWLLVAFDAGNYRIDLRPVGTPTALDEAAPRTVVHGAGWDAEDHSTGRVAQLYGGYLVPGSTPEDLHLVVSQWNTETNWPYRAMHFRVDQGTG